MEFVLACLSNLGYSLMSGNPVIYRFKSVGQALAYFSFQNPARYRPINHFEVERIGPASNHDFEEDSAGVWASVCLAIKSTLKDSDLITRAIFNLYYANPDDHLGREGASKLLGISTRHFDRKKRAFLDELENRLIVHGLMDPEIKQGYKSDP